LISNYELAISPLTQNIISPPCHPQPKAKRFGLGIHPLPSSRTWCEIYSDWIPVFTGMTHPLSSSTESKALRIGDPSPPVIPHLIRDLFRLDSRFHGN